VLEGDSVKVIRELPLRFGVVRKRRAGESEAVDRPTFEEEDRLRASPSRLDPFEAINLVFEISSRATGRTGIKG
jgi:hypothetical protein